MASILYFNCPYCMGKIEIYENEINCGIFRHAVKKNDNCPINPHAAKLECDFLYENNLIYGCGKPFQIKKNNMIWIIEPCDYI